MEQTICLNMIVKNESHIIEKTLNNLEKFFKFSYWVISDTGSTDNTKEIIKEFFRKRNIKGELIEAEWKNFAHNRNIALQNAYNKSDYVLFFDADDRIEGNFQLPFRLKEDMIHMWFGPGTRYKRPLIVNNRKKWKWRGVVHEFIVYDDEGKMDGQAFIEGDYEVISGREGARSNDPKKYYKDAQMLEEGFKEEIDKDYSLATRYAYYIAQSYKDSGPEYREDTKKWCLKTIELGGWNQERYHCCLYLADIYKEENDFEKEITYIHKAIEADKERMESVVRLAERFYSKGLHLYVNMVYQKFKNYQLPRDKLFSSEHLYNNHLEYYNSISGYYIDKKKEAYECCKKIICEYKQKKIDYNKFHSTINNTINHYRDMIDKDDNLMDFFLKYNETIKELCVKEKYFFNNEMKELWNYLKSKVHSNLTTYRKIKLKSRQKPEIILTFTTCKRLDLFKDTINSIMNTWEDVKRIDYWFCVDDNSSKEDCDYMKHKYPFIQYYFKKPNEKGHKESMNIIWNKLKELKPKYWIHMEDDFLFFEKMKYVETALRGLETMKSLNVRQVLFNREYAEVIEHYNSKGSKEFNNGEFLIHEHISNQIFPYTNCHYWPHYSFRPSMTDVQTILSLGNFDSEQQFFERNYADKWNKKGYKSAFFNKLTNIHTGRLTSEIGTGKINAYDLNNEMQFTNSEKFKSNDMKVYVINLDRRPDRLEHFKKTFNRIDFERFSGVDGKNLNKYSNLKIFLEKLDGEKIIEGEIGIKLTYYKIWKSILETEQEYYLIFEDDSLLQENSHRKLEKFKTELKELKEDWDFIYLGGQWTPDYGIESNCYIKKQKITKENLGRYFERKGDNFYYRKFSNEIDLFHTPLFRTAGCLFFKKETAKKMLDMVMMDIEKFLKVPFDMWLLDLVKDDKIRTMDYFPHIFYQGGFDLVKDNALLNTDIQRGNYKIFKYNEHATEFTFIKGMDIIGNDIEFVGKHDKSILQEKCLDKKGIAVNTLGFLKSKIRKLEKSNYFGGEDGIYILKTEYEKFISEQESMLLENKKDSKIRLKMIGNFWNSSKELCDEFNLMIPNNNYQWDNFEITWEDDNIDYYIIINKPKNGDTYDPSKSLVFTMEPEAIDSPYGVHMWGKWYKPDKEEFFHIHSRDKYLNLVQWRIKENFNDLKSLVKDTKKDKIASILSWKQYFKGHKIRLEILKQFENEDIFHVFGKYNFHNIKNYKHSVPNENVGEILKEYKYYFMPENNDEYNYITEKLWEPILCECLCFYWGCPNVTDYIDERAIVILDINNPIKALETMKQAIEENWWEQRIEYIREAKQKIMNELSFPKMITNIFKEKQLI